MTIDQTGQEDAALAVYLRSADDVEWLPLKSDGGDVLADKEDVTGFAEFAAVKYCKLRCPAAELCVELG